MHDLNRLTQITGLLLTSDAHGEDLVVAEALPTALAGLRSLSVQIRGARLVAAPRDRVDGLSRAGDVPGDGAGPSLASLTRLEVHVGSGACELLTPRLLPSSLRCLSLRAGDSGDEAAAAALLCAPTPPAPALRRLQSLELHMPLHAAWRVPAWLPALAGALESVRLPGIIGRLGKIRARVQGEIAALDAVARMGVREIKVEFAVKAPLKAAAAVGARAGAARPHGLLRAACGGAAGGGAAAGGAAARAFLRDWGHLLVAAEWYN
ncbi:hypothetical protein MNEG_3842 [Monoraphidium neglectum]|uniref:Uncharacterized protein n=1 Tax=Monoraphidium neglectum TaxID=145388 RepID=A0A0D2MUC9_9CHLO|nr:hypothetical protein MNEG_3842 [Monoraphidium neglectum]KIZ04117.1 hypothetical protein MNEG_3842 [Monoraphidium neglectum]|eukprot:XP_013903136.1 hypothetical protein MNEG_3842 [Monoraphidium neglectum]